MQGCGVGHHKPAVGLNFSSIDMSGFKWGTGDNALLLGTNVIGSIVAWGLMAITLLERPWSQLGQVRSCASYSGEA